MQEQEYLQAVHNISYRDRLYRVIAKHASEWYYGKDAPLWKTYLDTLTRDAPLWKTYLETFLDKMTWMKTVSEKGVALGSEPWHMHPIVFLNSIKKGNPKLHERCSGEFGLTQEMFLTLFLMLLQKNFRINLKFVILILKIDCITFLLKYIKK